MQNTQASSRARRVSRRTVLRGACLGCVGSKILDTLIAEAAPPLSRGCSLTPTGYRAYRSQNGELFALTDNLFSQARNTRSTGNGELDRELNRALRIAADVLEVNPAFGFFDPDKFREPDLDGMNAFAWPKDVEVPGTRGLVGFGSSLFRNELYGYDPTGTTIMCIVAHEYGHNLQWLRGYLDKISVLQCEINADFLAGYYLGNRKIKLSSLRMDPAEDLFLRLGRQSDGNPNRSHGNSVERVEAVRAGFQVGYHEKASLAQAVKTGWAYIGYAPAAR
jgi:hypothetical protein